MTCEGALTLICSEISLCQSFVVKAREKNSDNNYLRKPSIWSLNVLALTQLNDFAHYFNIS